MKKISLIIFSSLAAMWSTGINAQTPGDLLKLSQYDYSLGTARSAAMGGAFASLGADLASISINPAGLGMYRGSEVGISLSVLSTDVSSDYLNRKGNASKAKFAPSNPSNIGASFELYRGPGSLTSFSLGVGYNRKIDFSTSSMAFGSGAAHSMTEYFSEKLRGLSESTLLGPESQPYLPFDNYGIDRWGAILGYQTGIMSPVETGSTFYSPWGVLSQTATINPVLRKLQEGSVGEYSLAGGFNFQNSFYFGLAVGIQDIYYKNENNYFESYVGNELTLLNMNYIQRLKMDGTGVNFKIGFVARPTDNLRIGLAVHTPTFININEEYVEYMSANYSGQAPNNYLDTPYSLNEYRIQTPTRLMAGLSYTFPGIGLISADYERVWYNGMRLRNMAGGNWSYETVIRDEVQELYKAANNFRIGVELTPLSNLFVRAGYANYGDCQRSSDFIFSNQMNVRSYQNYSVGLGYRFKGNFYTDLTYVYTDYKYAPYDIFYYAEGSGSDLFELSSEIVQPKASRHIVTLSLGLKF